MYDAMEAVGHGDGLRLPVRPLGRPQPAPARARWPARTSGRSSRPRASRARCFDGLGNEDEFRTEHDGGMIGMSFRFFDADDGAVVDLLGRQPPLGVLDPPVFGSFSDGIGIFEGADTFAGRPIRRALHVVARAHAERRAGSRRSRPTAARRGSSTGSWTSRVPRRRRDERPRRGRARSRPATSTSRRSSTRRRPSRRAARCSSGTTSPRATARCPRAIAALARDGLEARDRARRARGRARVRHPAPLRRELLLPPDLDLAQRERALGDGLGQARRRRGRLRAVAARRRRTIRRSASGSCARSATSRVPGAATCARRAMRSRSRSTSRTPTPGWRDLVGVPARELGEDVERVEAVAGQQHQRVEQEVGDLADQLVRAGRREQHLGRPPRRPCARRARAGRRSRRAT